MKLRKTLAGILGAVVMLLGVGTFEHVNRDTGVHAADGTYEKATSIDVDDKVLLVYETGKKELSGITTSGTKYGIGAGYSGAPAGVYPLDVVKGSTSGTYAFKNGSNYIAWSSGNTLQTQTSLNNNSSWSVLFEENGDATISNKADSARKLQWNNGSPRFACYTSKQTAVQLYKLVKSDLVTLDIPVVTLNETTGVVTWEEVENANGYTYKINDGKEIQTTNTYVELKSGETFIVKANGTEGEFNGSAYSEPVGFVSYSDKVVSLLDDEYNDGSYLRHTIINIDADAVMEDLERLNENLKPEEQVNYANLFHAEVTMLERNTYFDGNQLWMENEEGTYSYYGTSENGKDLTSDRVSTLDDTSDKVVLKDVGGMEGYYTTLTDIIEHSKTAAWTYDNGVYTSENEQLIKDFLDFTAPCFYNAFSKDGLENYIKLSSITVQSIDDQVVLKLLVEDGDSGKLVGEQNIVLSQATISKFNIQRNDNLEKPVTITFDDTKKRTEYDTSHQVWEENGIVITNTKGSSSTNNVADYAKPVRFYKDSTVSITCNAGKFSTISIESDSSDNKYLTALTSSLNSISDVVVATSGNVVTITFTEPQSTFSFVATGGQVRINSITCA